MSLQEHGRCLLSMLLLYLWLTMHKDYFVAQKVWLVLKVIPNNTPHTFQEVGGVT